MLVMIIDAHTHIFGPDVIGKREELCATDRCFGLLYGKPKARLCSAEELIHSMDEQEIAISVVHNIGWSSHEMCLRSNDYIMAALERCYAGGMRGAGELRPDLQGIDLCDSESMRTLIDRMIALGMVLSLHVSEPVGHDYPGKGVNTPDRVFRFILQAKGLKAILCHMGGGLPFYEMMPEVGEALSDVFYDTAAGPFLYKSGVYKAASALCGIEKLIFGSDWPLLSQQRVILHIRESGLDNGELDALLGGNARRLFKID